jgi:hypothetical protein
LVWLKKAGEQEVSRVPGGAGFGPNVTIVKAGQSVATALTTAGGVYAATGVVQKVAYMLGADWSGVTSPIPAGVELVSAFGPTECWLGAAFTITTDYNLHIVRSLDGLNFENIRAGLTPDHVFAGHGTDDYSGVQDPSLLIYRGKFYCVYDDHSNSIELKVAVSDDLLTWTHLVTLDVSLEVAVNGETAYYDSVWGPNWAIAADGTPHIVAPMIDDDGVEKGYQEGQCSVLRDTYPNSLDPTTWGNPANWAAAGTLILSSTAKIGVGETPVMRTDHNIRVINGRYVLIANSSGTMSCLYKYSSANMRTGWDVIPDTALWDGLHTGEQGVEGQGWCQLADGRWRCYHTRIVNVQGVYGYSIRRADTLTKEIHSLGAPEVINFTGLSTVPGHSNIIRITDPNMIAKIMAATP